jgi:hypothetical protein
MQRQRESLTMRAGLSRGWVFFRKDWLAKQTAAAKPHGLLFTYEYEQEI